MTKASVVVGQRERCGGAEHRRPRPQCQGAPSYPTALRARVGPVVLALAGFGAATHETAWGEQAEAVEQEAAACAEVNAGAESTGCAGVSGCAENHGGGTAEALARTAAAADANEDRSAEDAFHLILRVPQQVFGSPEEPQVQETDAIDMMVLGTRAVGQGETTGKVFADLRPSSRGAAFDLVFRGKVRAQTVGQRGAAVIGSETWCEFELRAPVRLQRDSGFLGGCVDSDVRITNVRRKVASTTPGMRGRLVRRLATRRLHSEDQTIRQIVLEHTRQRLEEAFQRKFDERLERWNRWFAALQTGARRQPWFDRLPEFVLGTEKDYLLLGIDFDRRDDSPPQLPDLPAAEPDRAHAPLEVFLGPKLLDSPTTQLTAAGISALVSEAMAEQDGAAPEESSADGSAEPNSPQDSPQPSWTVGFEQTGPWTVVRLYRSE